MINWEKWSEIGLALSKHKLRVALTMFGVFWGLFMLVILLGAANGLENGVMSHFSKMKNEGFLWANSTTMSYKGYQPNRSFYFTNQDFNLLKQELSEVKLLTASMYTDGDAAVSYQGNTQYYNAVAQTEDFILVSSIKLVDGRTLNTQDLVKNRKVAIVGTHIVEELFPNEKALGKAININGVFFQIIGVVDSDGGNMENANREKKSIHLPLTTAQQVFNKHQVNFFSLIPKEGYSTADVLTRARMILAERHHVHPKDESAFGMANVEKEFEETQELFISITILSWVVAIGTILSGVVGVGNIMVIAVRERLKEFAIRKSIGATPFSVLNLVISESVAITGIAGYLGILLGVYTVEALALIMKKSGSEAEFFKNPEVDFITVIIAFGIVISAGVLAGIVASYKTTRMKPAYALMT